jgi:hypothetical protein
VAVFAFGAMFAGLPEQEAATNASTTEMTSNTRLDFTVGKSSVEKWTSGKPQL